MASIRCAHCKSTHASVAEVRYCSKIDEHGAPFEVALAEIEEAMKPVGWETPVSKPLSSLAVEPVAGVYMLGSAIYKVVRSPQTGNWYAKRYDVVLEEWQYAGRRPLHGLTAAHKMTAKEAASFGALTGRCVFCDRELTDERSIEVGYGPVCAERNGLPWG